jgi:hypothetical protein
MFDPCLLSISTFLEKQPVSSHSLKKDAANQMDSSFDELPFL